MPVNLSVGCADAADVSAAAAAEELNRQAKGLQTMVGQFKVTV